MMNTNLTRNKQLTETISVVVSGKSSFGKSLLVENKKKADQIKKAETNNKTLMRHVIY